MNIKKRAVIAARILALAAAAAAQDNVFRGLDFHTALTGTVPYRAEKECSFVATAGLRARTEHFSAIASVSQKEQLLLQEPEQWLTQEEPAGRTARFGVQFGGGGASVPYRAEVFAGTLRYARAWSRLKSPLPGFPSPLSGPSLPLPGIAPALPGFTSAQAPLSAALCLTPSHNGTPLPVIQCMCTEGGTGAASLTERLSFGGIRATAALSGGTFVHGQQQAGKSWFLKEAFYRERPYGAADAEFTLSSKLFSGAVLLGMAENPAGGLQDAFYWLRAESSAQFGALRIKASAFSAQQPDMLLPTGKKLMVRGQLQLSPQLTFKFPAGTLRTGIALQQTERLIPAKGKEEARFADEYKCKAATSFTFGKGSVQAQCGGSIAAKDGSKSSSARLSFSYTGASLHSTTAAAVSFSGKNSTLTFSERICPKNTAFSSINMQTALQFKDGVYERTKLSGGLQLSCKAHGIQWNGKLSLSGSF